MKKSSKKQIAEAILSIKNPSTLSLNTRKDMALWLRRAGRMLVSKNQKMAKNFVFRYFDK